MSCLAQAHLPGTLSVVLVLMAGSVAHATGNPVRPAADADGRQVYEAACAACHGRYGRGAPRAQVAFALPLPDFTDCQFAPREASHDWAAVTHEGGPARAFGRMMPAFGSALTDAQVDAAIEHVRTFCRDRAWPRGELNLPRPLRTEKAFPEDEVVVDASFDAERAGAGRHTITYERRLGPRTQWELKAPVEVQPRDGGSTIAGVGDVALAVKHAVYHSLRRGAIVSAAAEAVLPTGSERRGFGAGTPIVEAALLYGQILPKAFFVQAQSGFGVPVDRAKAAREAFWRGVVGRSFTDGRFGRTWSPMLEVVGARELVNGEPAQWDLVPQMQVTLSTRQHIRVAGGVQIPVTDTAARSTRVVTYFLWDWFDGGLFQGW